MSEDFHERITEIKATHPIAHVASRLNLIQRGPRFFCPSCQATGPTNHKTPDLQLYRDTNTFKCFKCGAGGDVLNLVLLALHCSFKEALAWFGGSVSQVKVKGLLSSATNRPTNNIITIDNRPAPPSAQMTLEPFGGKGPSSFMVPNPARNLGPVFLAFQRALPGSLGERYFKSRGFSLEQCQRFGHGYSAPGTWPHRNRDWKYGRVVFPTYSSKGEILNLYGRACEGPSDQCPKYLRHDFLPGAKGYLGVDALSLAEVLVTEGSFDWLALRVSGYLNSVCIFGLKSFRWEWFDYTKHLVLCFDADKAGNQEFKKLAFEGVLRGKTISSISPTILNGSKDLADTFLRYGPIRI